MDKLRKIFPRNKRGDISITILVIGTIVVCGIALFSFLSSTNKLRTTFEGIGIVEKINFQVENATFYGEDPIGIYLEKTGNNGIFGLGEKIIFFSAEFKGTE